MRAFDAGDIGDSRPFESRPPMIPARAHFRRATGATERRGARFHDIDLLAFAISNRPACLNFHFARHAFITGLLAMPIIVFGGIDNVLAADIAAFFSYGHFEFDIEELRLSRFSSFLMISPARASHFVFS